MYLFSLMLDDTLPHPLHFSVAAVLILQLNYLDIGTQDAGVWRKVG